jgi:hypothetical protein
MVTKRGFIHDKRGLWESIVQLVEKLTVVEMNLSSSPGPEEIYFFIPKLGLKLEFLLA